MSQNVVNYGIDPSGAQLLDELLSGEQQNRLTMDGGNSRPSYVMDGTVWTDKSVTGKATLKRFNGTSDDVLMTVDETTGAITIPGIADTDLSNLSGTGLNRFANRDLSNLSTTGKDFVAIKGYDNTTVYAENNVVLTVDSNDQIKIYKSLVDNNTSALTDTTKWEEVSLGGSSLPLLTHFWSDHEINETPFLRADTFSWQDGTVYSNAYNHLVDDIDGVTASTETVGGYTVTFYRATDGHKIVLADQETTVSNIYTATGVAWYYVLDTVNTRFKLPRTKYGFDGLRGNVGDYISESVPNITGRTSSIITSTSTGEANGALYDKDGTITGTSAASGGAYQGIRWYFDASRSSSAYQDDAPVQQRGTQQYLYFYIGQYTHSAIEQTAGLNSELFNGKADINALNFSAAGKMTIQRLGTPNYSSGANVTSSVYAADGYTPPSDGILFFNGFISVNQTAYIDILKNGTLVATFASSYFTAAGGGFSNIIPVIASKEYTYKARVYVSAEVFFFPLNV